MTIEAQYAQALFALVVKTPEKSGAYLQGLGQALRKRGHQKHLRGIFAECCKLIEKEKRSKTYATVTEESERTRVLLQLYRTLVAST